MQTTTESSPRRRPAPRVGSRPRGRIRWFLVILLAVTVFGGGLGSMHVRNSLNEPPKFRTVPIQRRDVRISIGTSGRIEPEEVVEVGALVAGDIVGFGDERGDSVASVEVGTHVTKGTILVQLGTADYDLALQKAKAALHMANADVKRLKIRQEQAERELQRAEELRSTNSESQFEKIATAHALSEAELEVASARLESARQQLKQAELNLSRTTIRAPIDGVVVDRQVNLGQRVSPGPASLFLLARDLNQMRIRASVGESEIGKVYVGQPARFTVDAFRGQELQGTVDKILMNARPQSVFVNYDVLISIQGSTESLLPHMSADVRLEKKFSKNAWLVPTDALKWKPSGEQLARLLEGKPEKERKQALASLNRTPHIWVSLDDGRVRPIPVSRGLVDGVQTEIKGKDLKQGMTVVVGTIRESTLARVIPNIKTLR